MLRNPFLWATMYNTSVLLHYSRFLAASFACSPTRVCSCSLEMLFVRTSKNNETMRSNLLQKKRPKSFDTLVSRALLSSDETLQEGEVNVNEVVEASKQPFNEVLTHVQFALHALTEDLRQTPVSNLLRCASAYVEAFSRFLRIIIIRRKQNDNFITSINNLANTDALKSWSGACGGITTCRTSTHISYYKVKF